MSSLRITLRAGERIFVNGAVLKVERKTTLEFLNDVTFLLESHVMQANEATTPLRQLYFIVQMMLIEPASSTSASILFRSALAAMVKAYRNRDILDGLIEVDTMVTKNRCFEALKLLRSLIERDGPIAANQAEPQTASIGEAASQLRTAGGTQ